MLIVNNRGYPDFNYTLAEGVEIDAFNALIDYVYDKAIPFLKDKIAELNKEVIIIINKIENIKSNPVLAKLNKKEIKEYNKLAEFKDKIISEYKKELDLLRTIGTCSALSFIIKAPCFREGNVYDKYNRSK